MFGVKQVVAVALWGGLAVGSAGCGADRSGEAATTSTPPTPVVETPPSTLDPETEVEQAYLAFYDMVIRLREDPNPDDPEIPERAMGETQEALVGSLTTAKTLGERVVFGPETAVDVLEVKLIGEDSAAVRSCVVESITVTNEADKRSATSVATHVIDLDLRLADRKWRVASSTRVSTTDGVQPCDQ